MPRPIVDASSFASGCLDDNALTNPLFMSYLTTIYTAGAGATFGLEDGLTKTFTSITDLHDDVVAGETDSGFAVIFKSDIRSIDSTVQIPVVVCPCSCGGGIF